MEIEEWSLAQKLELLVAFPRDFYRYQDEAMDGWFRWLNAPFRGAWPKKRRRSFHTRFKTLREHKKLDLVRDKGLLSRNVIRPADLDLSPTQFNVQGVARMASHCEALGVPFVLVDVPQRAEYRDLYLLPGVWEAFSAWMDAQPNLVHLSQPPDTDFYDMKHPNSRGRLSLSSSLVTWLSNRHLTDPGRVIEPEGTGDLE
jgi:hypothetical protein